MTTRDIYETTFDEDVQSDSTANQCPECDGQVITNAAETMCEDYGLVLNDHQIDHGPVWRSFDADEHAHDRTGAITFLIVLWWAFGGDTSEGTPFNAAGILLFSLTHLWLGANTLRGVED